jgi:hypothetical protein
MGIEAQRCWREGTCLAARALVGGEAGGRQPVRSLEGKPTARRRVRRGVWLPTVGNARGGARARGEAGGWGEHEWPGQRARARPAGMEGRFGNWTALTLPFLFRVCDESYRLSRVRCLDVS